MNRYKPYGSRKFLLALLGVVLNGATVLVYALHGGTSPSVFIAGILSPFAIIFSYSHYNVRETGLLDGLKGVTDAEKTAGNR